MFCSCGDAEMFAHIHFEGTISNRKPPTLKRPIAELYHTVSLELLVFRADPALLHFSQTEGIMGIKSHFHASLLCQLLKHEMKYVEHVQVLLWTVGNSYQKPLYHSG